MAALHEERITKVKVPTISTGHMHLSADKYRVDVRPTDPALGAAWHICQCGAPAPALGLHGQKVPPGKLP